MATLTATQKTQLRRRVGDSGSAAFTDDELQTAYDEAGSDLDKATVVLLEWLMGDAVKMHDYGAGQTRVSKSQVTAQVAGLLDYWSGKVSSGNQVRMLGLLEVPPRAKDTPDA